MKPTPRSRIGEPATTRRRALAYLADLAVVGGTLVAVARRRGRSLRERRLLVAGFGLVAANLYHVALEGTCGQTVGKKAVGVRVATSDGRRPTLRAATVRTLFRFVDWLPAGYLAAVVSIALTERRRRLGDLAADTVVVTAGDRDD